MSLERKSTCACGSLVAFFEGDPVGVGMCHCHACQRRSGGPYGTQARFRLDQFKSLVGEARKWIRKGDGGGEVEHTFCPQCGSTLLWVPDGLKDFVIASVGNFADQSFPAPRASGYEERMYPWVRLPLSVVEHFQ